MRRYTKNDVGQPKKPEIGDRLHLIPSYCETKDGWTPKPQPCKVVNINERGRFFMVQFESTGLRESLHYCQDAT